MKNNKELEIKQSLTLNNEKYGIIDFENQFGKGADIVLIHVDSKRAYIFEIKECSLDLNDVSSSTGAIEQIEYTEKKLKELGYTIMRRILLHVKCGNCRTFSDAITILKRQKIEYITIHSTSASNEDKKLYKHIVNIYRKLRRKH